MYTTPVATATASTIQAIGIAVSAPTSVNGTICVAAAPSAICVKPVNPDALPAACGRW